jgi:hypothetical protein
MRQIKWQKKIDVLELGGEILTTDQRVALVVQRLEKLGVDCVCTFSEQGYCVSSVDFDQQGYSRALNATTQCAQSGELVKLISDAVNDYFRGDASIDDAECYHFLEVHAA